MSIESKTTLLHGMELKLSTEISAADLQKVLSILNDQLVTYDVEYTGDHVGQADDMLNAYISAMRVEGRSEKTIERYRYVIRRMMDAVGVSTRMITVFHLRQYLAQEKNRGISDRTLEGNRQIFSAYFNWLQRERLIDINPTANLGPIKCAKRVKTVYTDVEIENLKYFCKSVRDRAIVSFLLSTGCRISEMTQLNRNDVDLSNLECTVNGKGDKERLIYIDAVTAMLIRIYLNGRTDSHEALFIGKGTSRMTPHGIRYMLNRLASNAGVEHVHPHKFRRTLATNLIHHGMPIQEVAAILGHDKLDTTMQYVVLDKTAVKNAYYKYA